MINDTNTVTRTLNGVIRTLNGRVPRIARYSVCANTKFYVFIYHTNFHWLKFLSHE